MSYKIETLSAVEKQITTFVSSQEVDVAIDAVIRQKRDTLDEQGFGKEKVPDNLIYEKLKKEVLSLTAEQIFDAKVRQALDHYQITPLNQIQYQADFSLERGKDLHFSFVAEIIPDLELPAYDSIEIEVKKALVRDEEVDQLITSLREQLGELVEVKADRLAADGDVVEFEFGSQGEFANAMGMSGSNLKLELGAGQIIADFENIIKSLRPGQSKTGLVTYPAIFPNSALAGQSVNTTITLKAIKRKVLPEVDDKLAQRVAQVGTVFELREVLRLQQCRQLAYQHEQEAYGRLLDILVQKTEVPLAPAYFAENLDNLIENYTATMQQRGLSLVEISPQLEEKKKQFQPEAETAARRQLFLLAVGKKEQFKLDPEEIEQEISNQARAAGTDVNQFKLEARQSGLIQSIKDALMMRHVMKFLFEKAIKKII